jgi:hypothetical protein
LRIAPGNRRLHAGVPSSLLAPLLPLRRGGAVTMAGTGCCGLEHTKEAWSSRCGSRRRGSARWRGAPAVDLGGAELTTGSHGRAGIRSRWWEGRGGLVGGSRASGRRRRGAAPAARGGQDLETCEPELRDPRRRVAGGRARPRGQRPSSAAPRRHASSTTGGRTNTSPTWSSSPVRAPWPAGSRATTVPPPRPSQVHSLQHRCLHELRCRAGAYSCQRSGGGDSRRWQALLIRRQCPSSPRSSTSGHRPLNPNSRGSTTTPSRCAKGGGCCWTPSSFAAQDCSPPCCILAPFADA